MSVLSLLRKALFNLFQEVPWRIIENVTSWPT